MNASESDIVSEADRLRSEGRVLEEFLTESVKNEIGAAVDIGGAFRYNLMLTRDLDASIEIDIGEATKLRERLASRFLSSSNVRKLEVVDNITFSPPEGRPNGVWFGVKVVFGSAEWNIDLWMFLRGDQVVGRSIAPGSKIESWLLNLPSADRRCLLRIKYETSSTGMGIPSSYVYAAYWTGAARSTAEVMKVWSRGIEIDDLAAHGRP